MGERKVLNKYYPPDFDPELLPRNKKPRDKQIVVRVMLPMSVCCTSCGEYMYRGKKFNARKETCLDEDYLGIRIFRFYIKCTACSSELTFKTDPKNGDYVCEYGASRNFEPWRAEAAAEQEQEVIERDEKEDAMLALEARTRESKMEMDILDSLDETKALKARHAHLDVNKVLGDFQARKAEELASMIEVEEEEEELLQAIEFQSTVRRLEDDEDPDDPVARRKRLEALGITIGSGTTTATAQKRKAPESNQPTCVVQGKKKGPVFVVVAKKPESPKEEGAMGLLGGYGSSSSGNNSPG